jgi:myo-inositol-1(or 4)-monophosphatase
MNLEKICEDVMTLAKQTGVFLLQEQSQLNIDGIEEKSANNYVTYVDKEAEKRLVGGLKNIFPEAGFVTEEGTAGMDNEEYEWIIDPIDGTSNFIHGLNLFCISIALAKKNDVLLGLIYDPAADECFYTWKGSKAYLNGKEISINKTVVYDKAMIGYDMPYRENWGIFPLIPVLNELFERGACRQLGTAALAMAYVACGRYDAYFHCKLNPWDMAAGSLLIRQAGGVATDFSGSDDFIFGENVICGTPLVFDPLKSLIQRVGGIN